MNATSGKGVVIPPFRKERPSAPGTRKSDEYVAGDEIERHPCEGSDKCRGEGREEPYRHKRDKSANGDVPKKGKPNQISTLTIAVPRVNWLGHRYELYVDCGIAVDIRR